MSWLAPFPPGCLCNLTARIFLEEAALYRKWIFVLTVTYCCDLSRLLTLCLVSSAPSFFYDSLLSCPIFPQYLSCFSVFVNSNAVSNSLLPEIFGTRAVDTTKELPPLLPEMLYYVEAMLSCFTSWQEQEPGLGCFNFSNPSKESSTLQCCQSWWYTTFVNANESELHLSV